MRRKPPASTKQGQDPIAEGEAAALRERALLILAAFDREEPSPSWAELRGLVQSAKRVADLRTLNRELRGAMAGMSPGGRAELERALRERFGPDREQERDGRLVAKVRARGRIRSEREYRVVQGYADGIAGDPGAAAEFLALGALLDEYMARP